MSIATAKSTSECRARRAYRRRRAQAVKYVEAELKSRPTGYRCRKCGLMVPKAEFPSPMSVATWGWKCRACLRQYWREHSRKHRRTGRPLPTISLTDTPDS
jgi:hypothetical protein